jgi:uncharacterized protein (AIM24 family)
VRCLLFSRASSGHPYPGEGVFHGSRAARNKSMMGGAGPFFLLEVAGNCTIVIGLGVIMKRMDVLVTS